MPDLRFCAAASFWPSFHASSATLRRSSQSRSSRSPSGAGTKLSDSSVIAALLSLFPGHRNVPLSDRDRTGLVSCTLAHPADNAGLSARGAPQADVRGLETVPAHERGAA